MLFPELMYLVRLPELVSSQMSSAASTMVHKKKMALALEVA